MPDIDGIRYQQYWDDLAGGEYTLPGMSQLDYEQWMNAQNMLNDIEALSSVNVDELLELRYNTSGVGDLAYQGGKYSEAEIKNIIDNLQGDGFKTNPLRMSYEQEVADLSSYSEELMRGGYSVEETAQIVNQARRDLGIKYKNMTPQPLRDYIYEINMNRYGDKLGPTYDYLSNVKMKTDLEIIYSSSTPNSNIDKLLGGFEDWLRKQ